MLGKEHDTDCEEHVDIKPSKDLAAQIAPFSWPDPNPTHVRPQIKITDKRIKVTDSSKHLTCTNQLIAPNWLAPYSWYSPLV